MSVPNLKKEKASPVSSLPVQPTHLIDQEVTDLVCFSHLRWNFVFQRPQHLLSRASRQWRVWFVEEPIYGDTDQLELRSIAPNLTVVVPHIPHGSTPEKSLELQRRAVDQLMVQHSIQDFIAWYYTPMALAFSRHLKPRLMIYDCMDELSAFLGAPANLLEQEKELLKRAHLVFTGGLSLFEAKQGRHDHVFAFPSSIDFNHFSPARNELPLPADLASIPGPRIGYSGVIDERMDLHLLRALAEKRPDWQFTLLGPVVKIDWANLPQAPNIHYLGFKQYASLPHYFSHWDVAIMPFAINEATRYISPTKTPEYLAAGLPVVSTPIHDVVSMYGHLTPVDIANSSDAFEQAIARALLENNSWEEVDAFLLSHSWDTTWAEMSQLIQSQLALLFE
ncbi:MULTISPECIES: glycosyltransferase family 1 protein [unclassified Spirosoma]|uniref:glycosyltransferase family 1 protein n=1 Tax=unclassified Spirosoma TaxID=2621999 RepID=UPI00095CD5F0|nr:MULTISPECIES: glycosyltransferase family 1 protein [unclassified Spirosoma]MBN8825238.1 glycosyltransferase family 1 protein [Spirosoma sp.]OJW75274.1 MAG: glycosyl transferase [Spirosoma sp. 48-14]